MNYCKTICFLFCALFLPGVVMAQESDETVVRDITFPVDGEYSFSDTWGAARSGGRTHIGTDIITDKYTPLVAAVDGRVTYITETERSWGYALYIQDSEGYSYRYLHINNDTPGTDDGNGGYDNAFADGIRRGSRVTAGQVVAYAGDSGNAESTSPHLHFEIWTPQREAINSYPSLIAAVYSGIPKSTYRFTQDLDIGSTGEDVYQLQKYLNQNGFIVASSGAGSPGNESRYFGSATQAALIKFQTQYNIPNSGYFGPITREAINVASGSGSSALQPGWLVKSLRFAEVFYVTTDLELRWVVNEAAAEKHFGPTWNQDIHEFESVAAFGLPFGENLD